LGRMCQIQRGGNRQDFWLRLQQPERLPRNTSRRQTRNGPPRLPGAVGGEWGRVPYAAPTDGGAVSVHPERQPQGCGELGWDAINTPGYPEKAENLLQVVYGNRRVVRVGVERADLSALAWAGRLLTVCQHRRRLRCSRSVLCPSPPCSGGIFPHPSA